MIDTHILESAVANWLWSVAKDVVVRRLQQGWPDFELRDPNGAKLLVELKGKAPGDSVLQQMAQRLQNVSDPQARFVLLTPETPSHDEMKSFNRAFKGHSNAEWLPVHELPARLGKPSPGPWDSPQTWSALQASALVKGIDAYKSAPMGPDPYSAKKSADELQALARQFSYEAIARLSDMPGTLEANLGLGSRRENVTIVLSDIVNFSSLVTASRSEDLREAMGQYYQRARQAIFDYNGMLDKFIGDAVLAVFGYPQPAPEATCNAIRLGQALIEIGRNIMESWQAELNAVIPTGTRVGIATGDIWPINIGQSEIEVALLGDTINLAARLEKNCSVDRLLMDNRTHTSGQRNNSAFMSSLKLQQIIIPVADAKGQAFATRAWASCD